MKNGFFVFKAEGREILEKTFNLFACIYRIYYIYSYMDYRNKQNLKHAQKCVKRLENIRINRSLTISEQQQLYLMQSQVENEYSKPIKPFRYENE